MGHDRNKDFINESDKYLQNVLAISTLASNIAKKEKILDLI